jgi:hypothetical protein
MSHHPDGSVTTTAPASRCMDVVLLLLYGSHFVSTGTMRMRVVALFNDVKR